MSRQRLLCAALALVATLSLQIGDALAISPVVADCRAHSNRLAHHYTARQLQDALGAFPADVREYSGCYQIIQTQLFAQINGKLPAAGASAGSGGSSVLLPVIVVVAVILLGGGGAAVRARRRGGGDPPV